MVQEKFNIIDLVNNDGCFDLQFRKDTRHERTNSPTYYRWKSQFVVTVPKEQIKILEKTKKIIGCGSVSVSKNQARFSVQKIDDIVEILIPFFIKNNLKEVMKKDQSTQILSARPSTYRNRCSGFELWQKAAKIINQNKGVYLSKWPKNDLLHLLEIHKAMAKHKNKPRKQKWVEMASMLTKKNET